MFPKTKRNLFFLLFFSACIMNAMSFAGERYKIISRHDFLLRYSTKNSQKEIDETLSHITQAYERLMKYLNVKPQKQITVVLYGTVGEFIKESRRPGWQGGSFKGVTLHLQPAGVLKEKDALKTTISHETSHVFISELTHGNCPLWLSEGFAVYFSGEMETIKPAPFHKISSFNDLSKKLQNTINHSDALQYYSLAGAFVSSVLTKYGQKKFLLLLKALGSGKSFARACRTTYNITEKQLFNSLINSDTNELSLLTCHLSDKNGGKLHGLRNHSCRRAKRSNRRAHVKQTG